MGGQGGASRAVGERAGYRCKAARAATAHAHAHAAPHPLLWRGARARCRRRSLRHRHARTPRQMRTARRLVLSLMRLVYESTHFIWLLYNYNMNMLIFHIY